MGQQYIKKTCIESVEQFINCKDKHNFAIIADDKIIPKTFEILWAMPFGSMIELIERKMLYTIIVKITPVKKRVKVAKKSKVGEVTIERAKFNLKDVFK